MPIKTFVIIDRRDIQFLGDWRHPVPNIHCHDFWIDPELLTGVSMRSEPSGRGGEGSS